LFGFGVLCVLYFVLGFYECLFGFVGFISVCLGFVLGPKAS